MTDGIRRNEPPVATRFKKGQSGNPRGRPRKQRQPDAGQFAFDILIDRRLTVVQDGKLRELTVEEVLQHKTYLDAVAGNRAAQRKVLRMIAERERAITALTPPTYNPFTILHEYAGSGNADDALLILGICCRNPSRTDQLGDHEDLLLEPWAVRAALSRRAGRKLTTSELEHAKRCTRDADKRAPRRGLSGRSRDPGCRQRHDSDSYA